MTSGISRRAVLATAAATARPLAHAQQALRAWVDPPTRPPRVVNVDATGVGYLPSPFDRQEARAFNEALAGSGINVGRLFAEAIRTAAEPPSGVGSIAQASDSRSANIGIEPRVLLYAMAGGLARLEVMAGVDVAVPEVRGFGLDCRVYPAPLPIKGAASWTDEGFRTLSQSVVRCARDILTTVHVELRLRRAGAWKSPVEMDRLQLIGHRGGDSDPVSYEGLVIWEDESRLAYAMAQGRGLGHLRNIRHILDKSLVTSRGPA